MKTKQAVSMAKLRQSRREAGIVKVEVWVLANDAAQVRAFAASLKKPEAIYSIK
jgi:hypothetical protein